MTLEGYFPHARLLAIVLLWSNTGCSPEWGRVPETVQQIRSATHEDFVLYFDSFSDPELMEASADARAVYVLTRLELRTRISLPDEPDYFQRHGPFLHCIVTLSTEGASKKGEDCYAKLATMSGDDSDVGLLVQETLQLQMASSLANREPWRAHRLLVELHHRRRSLRTLRSLLSFYVARGELSEAIRSIEKDLSSTAEVASRARLTRLRAWKAELSDRFAAGAAARKCGYAANWPCGPGQDCDCSESEGLPTTRVCAGYCQPSR
jgi:hypothetical protein